MFGNIKAIYSIVDIFRFDQLEIHWDLDFRDLC